jgi:hypothetical protein
VLELKKRRFVPKNVGPPVSTLEQQYLCPIANPVTPSKTPSVVAVCQRIIGSSSSGLEFTSPLNGRKLFKNPSPFKIDSLAPCDSEDERILFRDAIQIFIENNRHECANWNVKFCDSFNSSDEENFEEESSDSKWYDNFDSL